MSRSLFSLLFPAQTSNPSIDREDPERDLLPLAGLRADSEAGELRLMLGRVRLQLVAAAQLADILQQLERAASCARRAPACGALASSRAVRARFARS